LGKKKPKILMLGWEYPPHISGGLGIATYHLVKSLREFAKVELVLPDYENSTRLKISAYSRLELSEPSSSTSKIAEKKSESLTKKTDSQSVYGTDLMKSVEQFTQKATEKAKSTKFDIIHAHDWMTFPAALEIQKQSKKPLAIHIHSLETDRSANPSTRNPIYDIEEEAINKADLVIPVSEITKSNIEENYTETACEIVAVYNGGDNFEIVEKSNKKKGRKRKEKRGKKERKKIRTDSNSNKKKRGKKKEEGENKKQQKQKKSNGKIKSKHKKTKKKNNQKVFNILFVGRITAQKGVETLIRTAKRVLESNQNVKFTVVGLGDKLSYIIQLAEEAGIGNSIDFKGKVSRKKLPKFFKKADLLFMPSVSEPFGLVATEAAQFGLPIVMSNQSGTLEILPGILTAEYWDGKTFAKHILMLLQHKKLRKDFGKANQKAVKKYSWKRNAEKLMEEYGKLLNRG
jgi:glycogen(starch) synthase